MPIKPTQLREKLIQTGLDYVEQYGVETISLRLIAEKCQVSHGSPYKYFKNKQDYLDTVLAEIRAIFVEALLQDITETASDRQRLLKMGTNFVAFATAILTILTLSF
ncbi:TetR/AcrR family transcriptional regulator [Streptococcus hyointestinalis]|uniref:TetR/AcrR family transcriptional regulator n=1 Tax=Streptococcus hyointestinalis TaxID=1337 RepID=UPI0023F2FB1A|nr:TetR/AcrR family transcriptional regulator [Streptococcus hyointestinalis]MCI6871180.1 TetR/AcrR family transcriptional regulator [Streptococcus hyointestinalis]